MCSLHLTHPSVHTWSSGQPTVQRPGSSRGLPAGAGIQTHNLGLPQVSSPTLYPLGQRLPKFNSIWAEEFKHRIPEEHQGDGHYNSTGDMEQGRCNHPLPTQLQRNHPTITKTQNSPTGKRLRRSNNLIQIIIQQPHQHSKARQILHLA